MPLTTLHLLSLSPPHTPATFLASLPKDKSQAPILAARPIRWIITPSPSAIPSSHTLLTHTWDLLLLLPSQAPLPASLLSRTCVATYTVTLGIPSAVLKSFTEKNARLLKPAPADVPKLTGALDNVDAAGRKKQTAQDLELTEEILRFAERWTEHGWGNTAVSMLNLLAFIDGQEGEYRKYGAAFGESAGKRRGGDAKIVGKIVGAPMVGPDLSRSKRIGPSLGNDSIQTQKVAVQPGVMRSDNEVSDGKKPASEVGYMRQDEKKEEETTGDWQEVAIAHYPSIWHFADMLASEDYQAANHKFRLGSLRDTCILMTSEVVLEQQPGERGWSKL